MKFTSGLTALIEHFDIHNGFQSITRSFKTRKEGNMDTKVEEKMETVSYDSFISSEPFRFVVGPKKRVFTIHSALVASLSPVLEKLVNGDMLEAKTGSVVWEHVDEQTFVRFSQYAYMKTYEYPLSTNRPVTVDLPRPLAFSSPSPSLGSPTTYKFRPFANPDPFASPAPSAPSPFSFPTRPAPLTKPNGQGQQVEKGKTLWEKFEKQLSSSEPYVAMKLVPRIFTDFRDDDAEFLLSHARLYVFADCYGIKPLMRLSLSTLHHVLIEVPEDKLTPRVVQLLQYCYHNDTPAALKDLVVEYVVCRVETLWEKEEIVELAQDHGNFSSAVIKGLLGRIT
ncbi:hypothetical protein E4U15_007190 [Claviceps sp. LM218 group G6]|nr:hypothetical protein E4U15_007190 [Claviceps sp. LM218 group G6]KAG6104612.1 hypothetical protein E4U14_005586 [Claviceps sp. LM454 group G7]